MPCKREKPLCRTYSSYIGVGNKEYHGELCRGCLFWEDLPIDSAFKAYIDRYYRIRCDYKCKFGGKE